MEDSEGTETFTRMVNDLFDALNIKLPSRGVRRLAKEIQQHFGLARSFGGDIFHPTVVNFSQIFRLLSLYTPIKTALHGSVQGTPRSVLVSVTDTLKITKDAHQEEKVRLHDIVEAKMMEITTASVDTSEQGPSDHAYLKGEVEDSVVYYLCGYVIHKFTKHATCHLCIEDISSATPVLASDSYLTNYRSFKQGSLKHPTQKMLMFFKIVNKLVSACLDKEDLCGDIFWKFGITAPGNSPQRPPPSPRRRQANSPRRPARSPARQRGSPRSTGPAPQPPQRPLSSDVATWTHQAGTGGVCLLEAVAAPGAGRVGMAPERLFRPFQGRTVADADRAAKGASLHFHRAPGCADAAR
ncbi:hypothetical protein HPB48_012612 [Haemaphysalis longicornis]|uniref:Transposable element n=1 Tax=Haemaphysalis longicornis TaxID=44386 RepID=A0A9J6FZ50_HAELO|nr:hypothetical protein HPB48_012612 [Haemaphysalis longicornis]